MYVSYFNILCMWYVHIYMYNYMFMYMYMYVNCLHNLNFSEFHYANYMNISN